MTEKIKNKVLGFSVYNQYTDDDEIIRIALELCETYGWNTEDLIYDTNGRKKAWEYTIRAANEYKNIYAIATILFLKKYSSVMDEVGFYIQDESLLIEMIESLESIEEKDTLTYFLIARANFAGRGAELDYEKACDYFHKATEGGIEIAELFALEIEGDYAGIFFCANKLIEKYPDSHIIKFYLVIY